MRDKSPGFFFITGGFDGQRQDYQIEKRNRPDSGTAERL